MLYDFHTHSYLSDGELSPVELIRRAVVNGYGAIAITDHLGPGSLERVIKEVTVDCELVQKYWNIMAIPGVELTHLPPDSIDEIARLAKKLGAKIVVVHGESVAEPVTEGTNLAAVKSSHVDVLAHPGLITDQEATIAAENGIFIELSARKTHSTTNHHISFTAIRNKAKLLINSDAHDEDDLLTVDVVESILKKMGITELREEIMERNPRALIDKIVVASAKKA